MSPSVTLVRCELETVSKILTVWAPWNMCEGKLTNRAMIYAEKDSCNIIQKLMIKFQGNILLPVTVCWVITPAGMYLNMCNHKYVVNSILQACWKARNKCWVDSWNSFHKAGFRLRIDKPPLEKVTFNRSQRRVWRRHRAWKLNRRLQL